VDNFIAAGPAKAQSCTNATAACGGFKETQALDKGQDRICSQTDCAYGFTGANCEVECKADEFVLSAAKSAEGKCTKATDCKGFADDTALTRGADRTCSTSTCADGFFKDSEKCTAHTRCVPGVTFQEAAGTATADTKCKAVSTCEGDGVIVKTKGTELANQVCECGPGYAGASCTPCAEETFSAVPTEMSGSIACTPHTLFSTCGADANLNEDFSKGTAEKDMTCTCNDGYHFADQACVKNCNEGEVLNADGVTCDECATDQFSDGKTGCKTASDCGGTANVETPATAGKDAVCKCAADEFRKANEKCAKKADKLANCDNDGGANYVLDADALKRVCKAGQVGDDCGITCPDGHFADSTVCTKHSVCAAGEVTTAGTAEKDTTCEPSSAAAMAFSVVTLLAMLL